MSEDREPPLLMTRREYLLIRALEAESGRGRHFYVSFNLAREAVASTALAHPDWDMSEVRTLAEWEREA